MFRPQFTFSIKIITELGTIERLYGQLLGEKLIPSPALRLAQQNQILATHHSTSIEGNPLSPYDVTNIILGGKVVSTKSEQEVKNYFIVLNTISNLKRKHEDISVDLTQRLHLELMKDIEKKDIGKIRNGPVFVGHQTAGEIVVKHNPPFHSAKDITYMLEQLYTWLKEEKQLPPMVKAGIFHHRFAYIHPFFDGNGRLARLLTAYFLILQDYEVTKYFILDDYYDIDRQLYSNKLHTADLGDQTEWLEYFLEGISYSLQAALSRISELRHITREEIMDEKRVLVSSREEEVLQIVIDKKAVKTPDIELALDVSRQQAHSLLASLVKKGLLTKYGSTKTSYYKLVEKSQV